MPVAGEEMRGGLALWVPALLTSTLTGDLQVLSWDGRMDSVTGSLPISLRLQRICTERFFIHSQELGTREWVIY